MRLEEFLLFYLRAFLDNPEYLILTLASLLLLWYVQYLTKPKVFYMIRHGETLLNESCIKQGPEGALSESGIAQAQTVGQAFKGLGIEVIYSSPYERAVQTATEIARVVQTRIVKVPLLVERRNASEVIGKSTSDPEVKKISDRTEKSFHDDTYRFSDEENFIDIKERARKCMLFLRDQPKHCVVVVTHHALLQMLIATLLYQESLDAQEYVKLAFYNYASNTGVTTCIYRPLRRFTSASKGWEVVGYNQTIAS